VNWQVALIAAFLQKTPLQSVKKNPLKTVGYDKITKASRIFKSRCKDVKKKKKSTGVKRLWFYCPEEHRSLCFEGVGGAEGGRRYQEVVRPLTTAHDPGVICLLILGAVLCWQCAL